MGRKRKAEAGAFPVQQILQERVVEPLRTGNTRKRVTDARVVVPRQLGYQFVADAVAPRMLRVGVGCVLAPGAPAFLKPMAEIAVVTFEQRTNDAHDAFHARGKHAREAAARRAAQHAHKHRFSLVVAVMAQRNRAAAGFFGDAAQERIAHPARMVFKGAAHGPGLRGHIRPSRMERNAQPCRHVTDEPGIARALAPARVMVEMGRLHGVIQVQKHMQQRRGVRASGHGGYHALFGLKQRVTHNGGTHGVKKSVL